MALTKISTGGVKDDAVSQAIIADETIDEARLQISNAGSNGEFLQKQSGNTGGLTWAAANQYTHPNHSGEVTSTADGAQVIADNIVDEANLKVDNSPTNDHVLTAKSGAAGGLTWAAPAAGGNVITAVANGAIANNKAVKIDTDGKVSEVKMAPQARTNPYFDSGNGEAYALLGTSGTRYHENRTINIGGNKFLSIYSTNSRAEVYCQKLTVDDDGDVATVGSALTVESSGDHAWPCAVYDTVQDRVVLFYTSTTNRDIVCRIIDVSSTTPTMSGTTTIYDSSSEDDRARCLAVAWDPDKAEFLLVWSQDNDALAHWVVGELTNTTTLQFGSPSTVSHGSRTKAWALDVVYDESVDRYVILHSCDGGSDNWRIYAIVCEPTGTGTDKTLTVGSENNCYAYNSAGQEVRTLKACYDPANSRVSVAYEKGSNNELYVVTFPVTGGSTNAIGTVSGEHRPNVGGYTVVTFDLVYEPTVERLFMMWVLSNNFGYGAIGTYDSSDGQYNWSSDVQFTPGFHRFDALTHGNQGFSVDDVSGYDYAIRIACTAAGASTGTGQIMIGINNYQQNNTVTNKCYVYTMTVLEQVSTLTSSVWHQFIGFADQAYTNGQTATIKTYGNVVDTLSGLTAGTLYYVQKNGTVATGTSNITSAVYPAAGLALSSSKLLIRDPNAQV